MISKIISKCLSYISGIPVQFIGIHFIGNMGRVAFNDVI